MKDLIAREEMVIAANNDATEKLKEEKNKHDSLMNERADLEEVLRRKTNQLEEDTATVEIQSEKLSELRELIESEQNTLDETNEGLDE